MRFHHLTVTAFGPFAGTESIDFDELNDAGIFLLTGPTGSGKTSILDALCFALYGVVPGERGVKTLRSHHAAEGVAPEVRLDFSVGERRFVVRRSPEWSRPKKRGDGETRENAKASLLEISDGTERLISARAAEVGHELSSLLRMTSEQFMQVVMLPQGQFQTFLRATSDERQGVLQRLFRTERFARIEEWVREHSKGLAGRAAAGESDVRRLVETLAHRAGVDLPDDLTGERLSATALETAAPWARSLVVDARAAEAELDREHATASAAATLRDQQAREAARVARARRRRDDALAALASLADGDEAAGLARGRLSAHDRAQQVLPVVRMLTAARGSLDSRRREATEALERLGAVSDLAPDLTAGEGHDAQAALSPHQLRGVEESLSAHLTRLKGGRDLEERLLGVSAERSRVEASLGTALEALDAARAAAAELPTRRADLESERDQLAPIAAGRSSAADALDQARERAQAARACATASARETALAAQARQAREGAQDAREHHLDLVERRLSGMAAELAGGLVDGDPCQVCGSSDHPHPARPAADAVSRAEQEAAEEAARAARVAAESAEQAHAAARREVDRWAAIADGLAVEEADTLLQTRTEALRDAEEASARLSAIAAELTRLHEDERRLAEQVDRLGPEAAALRARLDSLTADATAGEADLEALRGPRFGTLAEALAAHETLLGRVRDAREALTEAERARTHLDDVAVEAVTAATQAGFDSADSALAAAMSADERDALAEVLTAREQERVAAAAVLEDPEVAALGEPDGEAPSPGEPGSLEETERRLAEARAETARIAGDLRLAQDRAVTLAALAEDLDRALTAWAPLQQEYLTADAMARLVRGTSGDNRLQMRLSSYVLATRLDQVLAAANERLGDLRDQRYVLQRSERARRKGTAAGLGLEVVDEWTGEVRDPATLSGGETFVVSLALALGLADVVSHEAGGVHVGTLFVDEGFGMLDQDTLDDVMDSIDALRAGGRTVGVVSHVTELRNRIPTQVHLTKSRSGSAIKVRTLVA